MKKHVTMRDIGAALGVSTVTVSKALGGREGVGDALRERILRTAEEMGYRYDLPAAEPEKMTGIVGILMPARFFSAGSFYAVLYRELSEKLLESGLVGSLEIVEPEKEQSCAQPALAANDSVLAFIVLGQCDPAYLDSLADIGRPMVLLDFYCENVDSDAIVSDGQGGAFLLTQQLLSQGHRNIAFLGMLLRSSSIMDRYSGYLRAMVLAGAPVDGARVIPDTDENGRYLPEFPLPDRLPSAVVCSNDEAAARLVRQLSARGIRVPEEISVVGFDDFLPEGGADLVTYHVDRGRMAQAAVERIRRRLNDGPEGAIRVVVGGWLVPGKSVGKCNYQDPSVDPDSEEVYE